MTHTIPHPYEIGGQLNSWHIRHVDTGKAIAWANKWEEAVRLCDSENKKANERMVGVATADD